MTNEAAAFGVLVVGARSTVVVLVIPVMMLPVFVCHGRCHADRVIGVGVMRAATEQRVC